MTSLPFAAEDVAELAEMLEFLGDWLASDRDLLTASLASFVGDPVYGPDSLRGLRPVLVPARLHRRIRRVHPRRPGSKPCLPRDTASAASGHSESASGREARDLDAAAVAEILDGLRTASLTGWLDATNALESLSYIRGLSLAIEQGELALIEAARATGACPGPSSPKPSAARTSRQAAKERHADLSRRHGSQEVTDTAGREQPRPAQVLTFPQRTCPECGGLLAGGCCADCGYAIE